MTISRSDIKEILIEVLEERQICEHEEQHEWLTQRIKADRERKLMYRAITRSAIGWSIPFLLTGIVIWLQTGHWPAMHE